MGAEAPDRPKDAAVSSATLPAANSSAARDDGGDGGAGAADGSKVPSAVSPGAMGWDGTGWNAVSFFKVRRQFGSVQFID